MLKENLANEIGRVLIFSIVMILLILAATTTSWFEPLLFMLTMGVAILINMGSNIIFGRISFLSYCVAAVLQLAVAMDYSIFLLHTFTAEKARGLGTEEAMENALHLAVGSIGLKRHHHCRWLCRPRPDAIHHRTGYRFCPRQRNSLQPCHRAFPDARPDYPLAPLCGAFSSTGR